MKFEEYCIKKRIDPGTFKEAEPERWLELKTVFEQVHPESFTVQKKFLINDLRRKYHLAETPVKEEEKPAEAKKSAVKIPGVKSSGVRIPPRPEKE